MAGITVASSLMTRRNRATAEATTATPLEAEGFVETAAPAPTGVKLEAPVAGDSGSAESLARLTGALAEIRAHAIAPMLHQALAHMRADRHKEGAEWALKALEYDENHAFAWHVLAICREKATDYSHALVCYERALELDPNHPEIANDLGRLAFRLELLEQAEKLFGHYLARNPGSIEGVNNLACVQRERGRFDEAVETLRPIIYAYPEHAMLWNTLGTVLSESGEMEQAVTFYDEALRLDPGFFRARYNRAHSKLAHGDYEGSLADCDEARASAQLETDQVLMRLARATVLLGMSRLEEGWKDYEARLDPHYADVLHYLLEQEQWTPERSLAGKHLLVVGEQGLGDEVLFANVLPDVVEALGPNGRLTIAVEPRLIPLFQRSFQGAKVTRHSTGKWRHHTVRTVHGIEDDGVELWTPLAQLLRGFRTSVEAFPDRHEGFLKADPERVAHWRRTLGEMAPGPKVGVLWKSLRMDANRQRFFSPFEQWRPVLTTPGATIVNLQYGDCGEELARARKELGVEILQPPGIDLMDDLDDLAALTCALDLTVGPANATTNIAAACGANVWLISTPGAWPRLGTDRYPWYPQIRVFVPEAFNRWSPVMDQIAAELRTAFPA